MAVGLGMVACQGDDSSQTDAGQPDSSLDVMMDASAEALALPPVPAVQYLGGTVLHAPHVIPILYSTESDIADVQAFLGALGGSTYWQQVTQEYVAGGSTLAAASPVIVTDAPPTTIDDAQIGPWLINLVQSDAGLPPPAPDNIYVIFYPSSTTVTFKAFGWTLCSNNLGYHINTASPALVYAVIPDCGPVTGRTTTPLDSVTSIASHEIIEAVTDPFESSLAWVTLDAQHAVWNFSPGSEVGDLCAFQPQSYQRLVGSYVVQRSWSNASAAAGHDPCVPLLSTPYFNSIPLFTDSVHIAGVPLGPTMTAGVRVPLGQSMTIPVQLIADGPHG